MPQNTCQIHLCLISQQTRIDSFITISCNMIIYGKLAFINFSITAYAQEAEAAKPFLPFFVCTIVGTPLAAITFIIALNRFNSILRQPVITVNDKSKRRFDLANTTIQSRVLTAIVLPDISDTQASFHHPRRDCLFCIIRASIIHNQPFKVFLCLLEKRSI